MLLQPISLQIGYLVLVSLVSVAEEVLLDDIEVLLSQLQIFNAIDRLEKPSVQGESVGGENEKLEALHKNNN